MAKACKFCVRMNSFVCNDHFCDDCNMCAPMSKEDIENKEATDAGA